MRPLLASLLMVGVFGTSGCGGDGNTSGPSDVNLIDNRQVADVQVRCPEYGEGSQCQAFAIFSNQTGQDVTGLATWSTSDPAIASVDSVGRVTVIRSSHVAIRAAYRGVTGFVQVWAQAGQGLRGIHRYLSGQVISNDTRAGIAGVDVRILDGPNAGRATITNSTGVFILPDLHEGSFTTRYSKAGYQTVELVWWIPTGDSGTTTTMRPSP